MFCKSMMNEIVYLILHHWNYIFCIQFYIAFSNAEQIKKHLCTHANTFLIFFMLGEE